jgi:hypothetical protein
VRWAAVCLVLAAAPAIADDRVTPTGKLDFELVDRGGTVVLRDQAYALTFPAKPAVQIMTFPFMGEDFPAVNALVTMPTEAFSLVVKPMPKHWAGSAAVVLDGVRDGFLQAGNAKLVAERPTKLAGLDGRHVSALVSKAGDTVYIELDLLWDPEHRAALAVSTVAAATKRSTAAQAFVSSLTVHRGTRGPTDPPPPPDGVATKTGVLDLEVVRHGASYTVRGASAEVKLPIQPTFRTFATSPVTVVAALAGAGEVETYVFAVTAVPAGSTYDPAAGMDGSRDGFLKQFSTQTHKEAKVTVAGRDGRRVEITGTMFGVPTHGELRMVWDPAQQRLFSVVAFTASPALPAAQRAFLDSLALAKPR